jgi:hypothetical protein
VAYLNAVSIGADLWALNWTLTHDAGSVLGAELRNAVGGVNGPLLGAGVMTTSSASPTSGTLTLSTTALTELKRGRAYVALPSAALADGLIRGQVALMAPNAETVVPFILEPVAGFPHPGTGGGATFINLSTFTGRYEAQWTSQVVATAAHVHRPDASVLLSMTLYPDAGGARGVFSLLTIAECQTAKCYNDVHTADAGAAGQVMLITR